MFWVLRTWDLPIGVEVHQEVQARVGAQDVAPRVHTTGPRIGRCFPLVRRGVCNEGCQTQDRGICETTQRLFASSQRFGFRHRRTWLWLCGAKCDE